MQAHAPATNRLTLDATLAAARRRFATRPPAFRRSSTDAAARVEQPEAGGERKVECELAAVAFGGVARVAGEDAAWKRDCAAKDSSRGATAPASTLALHIDRYESEAMSTNEEGN